MTDTSITSIGEKSTYEYIYKYYEYPLAANEAREKERTAREQTAGKADSERKREKERTQTAGSKQRYETSLLAWKK